MGNLLGGGCARPAKLSSEVGLVMGSIIAAFSAICLFAARHKWGYLFTNDPDVVALVSAVVPLLSLFEIFDCLGAVAGGILRGMGRQSVGAFVNLPSVRCKFFESLQDH